MAADRFAWGDAELIPEDQDDRNRMVGRAMDNFLRRSAHRRRAPAASENKG